MNFYALKMPTDPPFYNNLVFESIFLKIRNSIPNSVQIKRREIKFHFFLEFQI